MPDLKLTPWGEKGFARAMAICTNAEPSGEYPTQDKYSPTDEAEFIEGFNLGQQLFETHGYEVAAAYMKEEDEKHG